MDSAPSPTTPPAFLPGNPQGAKTLKRLSKSSQKLQLLEIMRVVKSDIMDPFTEPSDRAALSRAYCSLHEALRVERGVLKPGAYNVSHNATPPVKRAAAGRYHGVVDVESVVRTLTAPQEK